MKRFFIALSAAAGLLTAAPAAAQSIVVVELYTSQGCSSCPPADAFLGELAERDDIVALSLHVDYWDYLGWRDEFGSSKHTERQRAYRTALGKRMIYTPQMVVHGAEGLVGSRRGSVENAISAHGGAPAEVAVSLSVSGDRLAIDLAPRDGGVDGDVVATLFGFSGPHSIDIGSGENADDTITYHNVVHAMRRLGAWDGQGAWRGEAAIDPAMSGYAVVVQRPGPGPVLGAAKLMLSGG